jgi:hypothetical protein
MALNYTVRFIHSWLKEVVLEDKPENKERRDWNKEWYESSR